MEIEVAIAGVDNAAHLARISTATFALACPSTTSKKDLDIYIEIEFSESRFTNNFKSRLKSFFFASVSGSEAGYLLLSIGDYPDELVAAKLHELQRIYVLSEFQGLGISAVLMSQAFRHAADASCDVLWLGVSKHNNHLRISVYFKYYFQRAGEQSFRVGDDIHDDLIMSWLV